MKKILRHICINFGFFSLFILLDLYTSYFGLIKYNQIFVIYEFIKLDNILNLFNYIAGYLSIYISFVLLISLSNFNIKDTKQIALFNILTVSGILLLASIVFPQIFYPVHQLDYYISEISLSFKFIIYTICIISPIILIYLNRKKSLATLFGFLAYTILIIFQIGILTNIHLPSFENYEFSSEDKFVISLDSVRSDSFSDIQKYATGEFRKYLNSSHHMPNVVSDNTQTEGSFQSLFSGQQIYLQNKRYPFSDRFSSNNQKDLILLTDLKKKGYKNIIIRDEMDTAFIEPGSAIDKVILTSPNKPLSILLNKLNHSFVVFFLLPDSFSKIFLPTMFDNSNQPLGYDPTSVISKILKHIHTQHFESMNTNNKNLFFIHSCISHLPIKLKFPYNTMQPPKDAYEAFSYADFVYRPKLSDTDIENKRYEYDYNYYLKMIQYVTEQFLNPLFERLARSKNYNPSNIILISDHGENFWNGRQQWPIRHNFPFHGDNDLFGSKSDRPLFISNKKFDQNRLVNLSQVLKASLTDSSISTHIPYSENGFSISEEGADNLNLISFSRIVSEFSKKLNSNELNLSNDFEGISNLGRQRSIYRDSYKISLYRTPIGRKFFVCNLEADPFCSTNLWKKNINNSNWTQQFNLILDNDIKNGIEVSISLDKNNEIDFKNDLNLHKNSTSDWLKLYAAIVEINTSANDRALDNIKSNANELMLIAIKEIKSRYSLNAVNFDLLFSELDTFEAISRKIFSNRLYLRIKNIQNIDPHIRISEQFSSLSGNEKRNLYMKIFNELESIFKYSREYQFPYQNQLYLILLLKFSNLLDSRDSFIKFYRDSTDIALPVHFKKSLDNYLESFQNAETN